MSNRPPYAKALAGRQKVFRIMASNIRVFSCLAGHTPTNKYSAYTKYARPRTLSVCDDFVSKAELRQVEMLLESPLNSLVDNSVLLR